MMPAMRPAPLVVVALLATSPGCTVLPNLERNVCGNRIVEPDSGEDCDGGSRATRCGAPRSAFACRLLCDPSVLPPDCPDGYGCGSDGVCREPTGEFQEATLLSPRSSAELATGDFDADGRDDVVLLSDVLGPIRTVDIARYDPVEPSLTSLPGLHTEPVVGRFNADSFDDVAFTSVDALAGRFSLSLFTGGRLGLQPTTFPSVTLSGGAFVVAANVSPHDFGQEPLWVEQATLSVVAPGVPPRLTPIKATSPREIVAGPFDAQNPCDLLLEGAAGSTFVSVHRLCVPGEELVYNRVGQPDHIPTVNIALSAPSAGVLMIHDVNSDGMDDVFVATAAGMAVTYAVGDGTFHSDAVLPMGPGDMTAALWPQRPGSISPTKVADLDGDGAPDFFDGDEKRVYFFAGTQYTGWVTVEGAWNDAVFDDFNADGIIDIAAALSLGGLVFYQGTGGGAFTPVDLNVTEVFDKLRSGDTDGDNIRELIALTADGEVFIAHGRAFAPLGDPLRVASFPGASDIAIADLPDGVIAAVTPRIDDVFVIAAVSDGAGIAILQGNPQRLYDSPLPITVSGNTINLAHKGQPTRFDGGMNLPVLAGGNVPALFDVQFVDPLPQSTLGQASTSGELDRASLVMIDLDDDGEPELAALAPSETTGCSALITARRGSAFQWVVDTPQPMAEAYCYDRTGCADEAALCLGFDDVDPAPSAGLIATDVDGDQDDDLVALLSEGVSNRIFVFPNDGSGTLDVNSRYPLEGIPHRERLLDFAAIRVGSRGADIIACSDLECFISADRAVAPEFAGGVVAVGDVDGDGVDDIVTAPLGDGTFVHLGIARVK